MRLPEHPALCPDVRLVGELRGTGFRQPQWLIQRDGQFLQVTELLYRIAEHSNGYRTVDEIAAGVSDSIDRLLSPDQVRQVLGTILIPRGLVTPAQGAPPVQTVRRVLSPLAVNIRLRIIGPRVLDPIARVLQPLYAPPLLIAIVVAIVGSHWWLYFNHGIDSAMRAALFTPGALLLLLGLLLLSSVFHEFGHAAALRYSGGRVRGMGAGVYIVYPVLYTDVTDSYRLGRAGRLRTDLGGFYFQLIFGLGMLAIGLLTGHEALLIGIPLIDLAIIRQSLPIVRFDGYWIFADLTGIPDFFSSVVPFVLGFLPGRAARRSTLPELKTWVKVVFVVYLAATVPLLGVLYVFMVRGLPEFFATTQAALRLNSMLVSDAWARGDIAQAVTGLTQMIFLALPLLGIAYVLYATGRRLLHAIWKWGNPTPTRRAIGALVYAGLAGLVAVAWVPQAPLVLGLPPAGVQEFAVGDRSHVTGAVDYPQSPPVGGAHAPIWLNCGFYSDQVSPEYAVHSLEHGAVWITYRPDLPSSQASALRQLTRTHAYVIASPYPDLQTPIVATAWGKQLELDTANDARLSQFVRAFEQGSQTPEPGGACTGGVGAP